MGLKTSFGSLSLGMATEFTSQPRKFFEIRCSEIASGSIFGEKQSRSSYQFLAVLHAFAKPADFKSSSMREGTKGGRTVGGVTSVEGRLVNSQAPDIAIYLCTALAFIAAA